MRSLSYNAFLRFTSHAQYYMSKSDGKLKGDHNSDRESNNTPTYTTRVYELIPRMDVNRRIITNPKVNINLKITLKFNRGYQGQQINIHNQGLDNQCRLSEEHKTYYNYDRDNEQRPDE